MHMNWTTIVLGISSMAFLLQASVLARQALAQGVHEHTIVFECEHGSATSVIAATRFNDLANKNGLPYGAIARGVNPDKGIPRHVKNGLAAEDLYIRGWQPKRFSEGDALKSDRVITLACPLPTGKSIVMHKLQQWTDFPSPSAEYHNASRTIAEWVGLLLREGPASRPCVIPHNLTKVENKKYRI